VRAKADIQQLASIRTVQFNSTEARARFWRDVRWSLDHLRHRIHGGGSDGDQG
jgi:hypothetical protein